LELAAMSDERYEQIDSPVLAGLDYVSKAQVVNRINTAILAEVVEVAGGEVFLPAGFQQRVASCPSIVVTRFMDDGRYRVWTEPLTPETNHPGVGTRWERTTGPRRREQSAELWEVVELAGGMALLERIGEDGCPVAGTPVVHVREDYLRRGVSGWRHWAPPRDVIETLGGRP
jgi:hypothetical protein